MFADPAKDRYEALSGHKYEPTTATDMSKEMAKPVTEAPVTVPKAKTAFVHRNALYSIQYYEGWSGSHGPAALRFIRDFYRAMRPYVSGFAYQNYIDPKLPHWQHAYYAGNYPRLVSIKKHIDPTNFFHFPQSIRLHV